MGIGLRIRQYLTGICVLVSAAVFTSNAVAYDFMPVDIVYYIIAGAACLVIVSELSNFISLKRLDSFCLYSAGCFCIFFNV